MDPTTTAQHHQGPNYLLFFPGVLVALGALFTLLGIGAFMASGAVEHVPKGTAQIAQWMAGEPPLLVLSGYLSIVGNVALVGGALMLAHLAGWAPQRRNEVHRVDLPGVWATLVFAVILILPYDLALPRGLIPLAAADPTNPLFGPLYNSLDLTHSVGLIVFYLTTTAIFVHQARTAAGNTARWGWRAATVASVSAVVVAIGLVVGRPPVFLVPSVFLTWAAILWLGLRMASGRLTIDPSHESRSRTAPRSRGAGAGKAR